MCEHLRIEAGRARTKPVHGPAGGGCGIIHTKAPFPLERLAASGEINAEISLIVKLKIIDKITASNVALLPAEMQYLSITAWKHGSPFVYWEQPT